MPLRKPWEQKSSIKYEHGDKKIGRDACRVSSVGPADHHRVSIAPENGNYQSRDFLWRLSSATVELEESTFTSLPDFDRIILTLEGRWTYATTGDHGSIWRSFRPIGLTGPVRPEAGAGDGL